MAEARTWAWFAGGLAGGLGLAGILYKRSGRRPPLGRVYKVADRYFADEAVVDELVRRVPGSIKLASDATIYLYRRGRLAFRSDPGAARTLPDQVGKTIYSVHTDDADLEDVVIELVRFGLARPGGAFPTWPIEQPRGTWTPPAEPLHPEAFDVTRQARNAAPPQLERRPRPIGHYFQVGDNFYADENFLLTLEGFSGADYERRAWVPLWRRGHLEVFRQTAAKMLPEQVGELHRIEPHLAGVSLADLLIELENLGLVSWGGAWPKFPERLSGYVPTGPLTPQSQGRVFEHEDRFYLDEAARQRVLSRLPVEAGSVLWRGRAFQLVWVPRTAKGDSGGLFLITPVDGAPADFVARAFAEDLVLHRIARHADAPTTLDEPDTRTPEKRRADDDRLRAQYYARRFEDLLGYAMPAEFSAIVLRHLRGPTAKHNAEALVEALRADLRRVARTLDDPNSLPALVELASDLIREDDREPWRELESVESAAMRAAVGRLAASLPRPELAPLRSKARRKSVRPGSLIVLPLDPAEAAVFDPEDRFALALRLPSGQGFMFSFGESADPSADDLRDPTRLWDWDAAPDTEVVVLARDLDWTAVAELLDLDPDELGRERIESAAS